MMNLYTIQDTAGDIFNTPFHARNDQVAMRECAYVVNETDGQYAHHPQDFILWNIGQFDEETGKLYAFETAVAVTNMLDLIQDGPELPNVAGIAAGGN